MKYPPIKLIPKEKKKEIQLITSKQQSRNKMIFGRLMNHLNKAKDTLQSQQEIFKKQAEFQQQVDQKSQQQQQQLKQKAIEDYQNQKQKELDQKAIIEKELFQTQLQIMYTKSILDLENRSKFIKTKGKFGVYWKPAKWNDELQELLKEQNKLIDQEKKKIEEQFSQNIEKKEQPVESSKFNRSKREEEEQ